MASHITDKLCGARSKHLETAPPSFVFGTAVGFCTGCLLKRQVERDWNLPQLGFIPPNEARFFLVRSNSRPAHNLMCGARTSPRRYFPPTLLAKKGDANWESIRTMTPMACLVRLSAFYQGASVVRIKHCDRSRERRTTETMFQVFSSTPA